MTIYTAQVNELVAIAAAIAGNCEPCLKYHYDQPRRLGVTPEDMRQAVIMAQRVKDAPAGKMLELASRLLDTPVAALRPPSVAETDEVKEPGHDDLHQSGQ